MGKYILSKMLLKKFILISKEIAMLFPNGR